MAGNDYHVDADTLSPDPRTDIKDPLERIISRIIDDIIPEDYAWNAVLILLFNHIDLLGNLLSGDTSKANQAKLAVNFIRLYLGKVDEKYAMAGGFIYYMLGNGLIHKSYPRSFNTGDGRMLRFEFSNTQENQKHLSVTQSSNELRFMFLVDIFYKDLLDAIDLYCLDMSRDRSLQEKYRLTRNQLTEQEDRTQIRNHAYILESDFGFINDQIS
ncbi:hypothetical protein ACFLXY_00225 [Chloroflexota bacterium]